MAPKNFETGPNLISTEFVHTLSTGSGTFRVRAVKVNLDGHSGAFSKLIIEKNFMKPHKISFVNAVTLISFGLWGYIDVDYSPTALIPVVFGVIILALNSGLKKENKTVAHIVVLLTFLILGGLFKPLMSTIESGSAIRITRVGLMMLSTLMALVVFIKSFIANRSKN